MVTHHIFPGWLAFVPVASREVVSVELTEFVGETVFQLQKDVRLASLPKRPVNVQDRDLAFIIEQQMLESHEDLLHIVRVRTIPVPASRGKSSYLHGKTGGDLWAALGRGARTEEGLHP